jgi:peroxiredoxin
MLAPGIKAPDFTLYATPDQKLQLNELLGKRIILAFYPADWSPVCGDQMSLYNEMRSFFRKYNAEVLGLSVDSKWSHMAFAENRNIHFPLLADFEPKGQIAKDYGVYNEQEGHSKRALFVLNEAGIIEWSYLSPEGMNPGADGILEALENMDQKSK